MLNRRGFLAAALAAGTAPAILRSGVIMPLRPVVVPSVAGFVAGQGITLTYVDSGPLLITIQSGAITRAKMESRAGDFRWIDARHGLEVFDGDGWFSVPSPW